MSGACRKCALVVLGLVVASGACTPVDQSELELAFISDVATYTSTIHPYLERRCATLDCHGDPGRPLRLYSETGLRAVGHDRDLPLVDDELALNVDSITGVDPFADADHHVIVLKPLAPSAGGMAHVGGDDIWADRGDPGYVCLRDWLAGRANASACTAALDALPAP